MKPHARAIRVLAPLAAAATLAACTHVPDPAEAGSQPQAASVVSTSNCDAQGDAPKPEAPGQAGGGGAGNIATNPEIATGFRSGMHPVKAEHFAVVTANPLATDAACRILLDGGNAADAVAAAQFVLGLAEPQSSGVGGGGYILFHEAATGKNVAIDGRETAPQGATETYLDGAQPSARASGRSIGVPGIVAALGELHRTFGAKPWADTVAPAERLARDGFRISPRLGASIREEAPQLAVDNSTREYFLHPDGSPKLAGETLQNPEYARTLGALAEQGPRALYQGELAAKIVDESRRADHGITPSVMTLADVRSYHPNVTEPLCGPYREQLVCGMPPSSSGGVAVLETLRLLDHLDLGQYAPHDAGPDGALPASEAAHLISEAERLAYADRDAYVGDPDYVAIPGGADSLLADEYVAERASQIDPQKSMGKAKPGELMGAHAPGELVPEHGTSHISVIDGEGNAASMTTSVESAFGSYHMTGGFLLNNQLTDFTANPVDAANRPAANRVQPGKRPRSSMSPLLVFDGADPGKLRMVVGSPGGSLIIQFVVKTLVGLIDWGLDPQQAVGFPDFGAINEPVTRIGGEHPLVKEHGQDLVGQLEARGHRVNTKEQSSGLSALVVQPEGGIVGGADPRREGTVRGN